MRALSFLLIVAVAGSTPALAEWESTTNGPDVRFGILALALDPANPNILYAGDDDGGLFKSIDHGDSWETLWEPEPDGGHYRSRISSISVDPHAPHEVYVVSGGDVHRSDDGGTAWTQLESLADVEKIQPDANLPGALYAESTHGLLRSTDRGQSWEDVSPTLPSGYGIGYGTLSVSPHDSNVLLIGAGTGHFFGDDPETWPNDVSLLTSSDGGSSWSDLSAGVPGNNAYISSTTISPVNPELLYAGGWDGEGGKRTGIVLRSTDAGQSWARVFQVEDGNFWSVAADPHNADVVYAGSLGKVSDPATFTSRDGGITWSRLPVGGSTVILVDPLDRNRVYTAIREGGAGVYRLDFFGKATSIESMGWGRLKSLLIPGSGASR